MKKEDKIILVESQADIQKIKQCKDKCKVVLSLVDEFLEYSDEKLELLDAICSDCEVVNKINNAGILVAYERLPKDVFEKIYKFERKTNGHFETELGIDHSRGLTLKGGVIWDIQTIVKANSYIDAIVKRIRECDLTPAEALAYIHQEVSTIAYYARSKNQVWNSKDQYFAGAFMKNSEFVCAGYASLENEIIDALNMQGLKSKMFACDIEIDGEKKREGHMQVIVCLDDPKYGIYQTVFDDPTWDSLTKNGEKTPMYAHCFLPYDYHDAPSEKYKFSGLATVCQLLHKSSTMEYRYDYDTDSWGNFERVGQNKIEEIMFSMLAKTKPKKSFEEVYMEMCRRGRASYAEQRDVRKYNFPGRLMSPFKMNITRAKEIWSGIRGTKKVSFAPPKHAVVKQQDL